MAKLTDGIDSCPFCGGLHFVVFGNKDEGGISCACGASIRCKTEPEFYELVIYDLHRKVPARLGLEIAKERWNRRANADVAPVVRGRWIGHDVGDGSLSIDADTCSLCGSRFYQIAETGCDWNFCPNCGAKMEEKA